MSECYSAEASAPEVLGGVRFYVPYYFQISVVTREEVVDADED